MSTVSLNSSAPRKVQLIKVEPQKDERVTFQSETDGRSNFLNQSEFHAFCKQRDIFYAIKDSWMKKNKNEKQQFTSASSNFHGHHNSNFNSNSSKRINLRSSTTNTNYEWTYSLQQKVKQLIQLNSSPSNLSHLASLCISQYILDSQNCKNNGEVEMDDENFRQFFQSNPLKFKQLENRLENRFVNEPLSFLKYFVDLANWADFNQHLIDRCIMEITEVDALVERQEVRSTSDLVEGLNKCRILAQVLGFLYFRPYRPNNTGSRLRSIEFETYLRKQINLRNYHQPPINLMEKIYESLSYKKLVFTLPWIIDFLSQADAVTYHLPSYKRVISLIGQLYRTILTVKLDAESKCKYNSLSRENQAFLRLYCGRWFQMNDFPTSVIFSEDFVEDAKLSNLLDLQIANLENAEPEDDEIIIDSQSSIGDALVSIVFEKQNIDMQTILSDNFGEDVGSKTLVSTPPFTNIPVKHIRPVPATRTPLSPSSTQSEIEQEDKTTTFEMELESCFFQNHPPSVKRTVEFISDRVASNFVKILRTNLYPEFLNECIKNKIFGQEAATACQEKLLLEFETCLPKAGQAVDLLIGDISEGALVACKQICVRRSKDKVQDWISSHINKDLFPEANITNIKKSPNVRNQQLLSPCKDTMTSNVDQSQTLQPKFRALVKLQQALQIMYKRERDFDISPILPFVTRDQLGNSNLVVNITVDIVLSLLTFYPQKFTQTVEESFLSFWKQVWRSKLKILCPRNILLFEQSTQPDLTWTKLLSLVNKLVKVNVMNVQELEEQCLGFVRHDWPPATLNRISEFSRQISGGTEVITWLSWACSENADY